MSTRRSRSIPLGTGTGIVLVPGTALVSGFTTGRAS